jgi:N-acyl-D-amino-acid deacylase
MPRITEVERPGLAGRAFYFIGQRMFGQVPTPERLVAAHPRSYGTFARVLGPCVRERGLLTLPQAIFKMTGGSAAALGLADRGIFHPGAWADITVFDPDTIADQAKYDDPHQYAVGVSTVVVNGTVVIDAGDHTDARPGRVLRFPRRAA